MPGTVHDECQFPARSVGFYNLFAFNILGDAIQIKLARVCCVPVARFHQGGGFGPGEEILATRVNLCASRSGKTQGVFKFFFCVEPVKLASGGCFWIGLLVEVPPKYPPSIPVFWNQILSDGYCQVFEE